MVQYNAILHLEIINIVVMVVSLIAILVNLQMRREAKFKDETHQILRRQLIYFLIINFYEIPFKIFCAKVAIESFMIDNQKTPKHDGDTTLQSNFGVVVTGIYFCRGFLLPILRLLDPGFFNQLSIKLCLNREEFKKSDISLDETDPDIVFLSSKKNNLLVAGILQGIVSSFDPLLEEKRTSD